MSRNASSDAAGALHRQTVTNSEQRHQRIRQRSLIASAVASCLMLASPATFSQSVNSNLRGQVSSEAGPAADTEVVVTNQATGAVRRTRTSPDGSYVLVGLPPGTYKVEAGGLTSTVTLSV